MCDCGPSSLLFADLVDYYEKRVVAYELELSALRKIIKKLQHQLDQK
jgi:hypothetical protein